MNLNNKFCFSILISILAIFLTIYFSVNLPICAEEDKPQELVTIRNEKYQFEVTVPKTWTYTKVEQADPEEGMKTGQASFSITVGRSQEESENWNGLAFNSSSLSDNPQPFVSIYSHKKSDKNPIEFAKLFESTIGKYRAKVMSVNHEFSVGDAIGFDYKYTLFVQSRYTALYRNGTRVVIHYFFPSNDTTLFGKFAPEVDKVIKSLKIK
jgi:hypothetical protein